jgi:hypothetical protein
MRSVDFVFSHGMEIAVRLSIQLMGRMSGGPNYREQVEQREVEPPILSPLNRTIPYDRIVDRVNMNRWRSSKKPHHLTHPPTI